MTARTHDNFPDQGESSPSGQAVHQALRAASSEDLTHANPYYFGDGLVAVLKRTKEDRRAPVEVIMSDEKHGVVVPAQVGPDITLVGDGLSMPWKLIESDRMVALEGISGLVPDGSQTLGLATEAALLVPEMSGTKELRALIADLAQD